DRYVLHSFNRNTMKITNYGIDVSASAEPLLQFIDRGLVTLSQPPQFLRRILRDVDGDGVFEEPIPPDGKIAGNCPTVANPFQEDATGDHGKPDGIGDLCECPILSVDSVQAFAGSQVQVPVDLDPGPDAVASLNFTFSYPEGYADGSVQAPMCAA